MCFKRELVSFFLRDKKDFLVDRYSTWQDSSLIYAILTIILGRILIGWLADRVYIKQFDKWQISKKTSSGVNFSRLINVFLVLALIWPLTLSGPNHILPTKGAGKYTGGLYVGKFIKTVTYQKMNKESNKEVGAAAARLTALGIRQVPSEIKEAALAFGSTERQLLYSVELPLALPSIMAGINQVVMMCLSMVVIAALIGAGGMGLIVVEALANTKIGRGILAGLAIAFIAMIIDRVVQKATK